ncbi:MAG: RtcB family protein [Polyangiaceae bacterium]|nr:RtcB family protein [Polyangiaceae bacterium]
METNYNVLSRGDALVKAWTVGVPFDEGTKEQLLKVATMPFIHRWVAAMPDAHVGIGATVGSVIATHGAIIPSAVGVDIGCGMTAARTSLKTSDLPDSLASLRSRIERAVPHGRGMWSDAPAPVIDAWAPLAPGFARIQEKVNGLLDDSAKNQIGTLGTGNHFVELCADEHERVWVMLHSGSRGVGNRIGSHFIARAKREMEKWFIHLPDENLAYFPEGTEGFSDYMEAVGWAQDYARANRDVMMSAVLAALSSSGELPPFNATETVVSCHHNYVAREHHFGKDVFVTRKGAVRARLGDYGIVPGSMGAGSFIVRGLGNTDAFESCSHGAGRAMTRTEAKRRFSVDDHAKATAHVECRKDEGVIDETPMAYKPINDVMRAQRDLVEIAFSLRPLLCVKG